MSPAAGQVLLHFPLGQHQVALTRAEDGSLSLWLDGCLRKTRPATARGIYLWTNVELPFEDHHLVEVRQGPDGEVAVTVNGTLQQAVAVAG